MKENIEKIREGEIEKFKHSIDKQEQRLKKKATTKASTIAEKLAHALIKGTK